MNSWACENGSWNIGDCVTTPGTTYSQPLTLNIYGVNLDGSLGSELKTVTQTFNIPYRPSATPTDCGNATQWYNASTDTCQNGYNVPVTFDLGDVTLPDQIVFGVEYNTHTAGYAPIGSTGDYDSLNVSLVTAPDVTVGTQLGVYRASTASPTFAPSTIFDALANKYVAAQFNVNDAVVPPATPQSKDDCKKDGWKTLVNANGDSFKNQGQCVSYVTASENSKAKRGDTLAPSVRF